ncbi:hypothetical protein [Candidatus Villigracilis saccharophilus]|uniref:hypothetical protein n=1 Tax=Candidatus Villigracilis saccharophilus TaxID=3140684 RepID=UPI003134AD45|nr:hypothetical protein [Anaerolineales bacterium]
MPPLVTIIKRISISLLIGLVIGALINEISFLFLRETARAPKVVELVIPDGTAERVARGETPPALPDSMTFVVGDTLLVRNEDKTDHELGPLWIPAGTSASLALDSAQSYAYSCSFQPEKYFGMDVHEPLTFGTRLYGILYSGLPLGGLIALYVVIMPEKRKDKK